MSRETPHTSTPSPAPPGPELRRAFAELMARAAREVPHYHLATTIDLATALDWLHERNLAGPAARHLVATALLLKAAALSARAVPELNGYWAEGRFTPAPAVNLAVSEAHREGGPLTPVIHGADELTLDQLMGTLRDLVERALRGGLRPDETSGASLTATALGDDSVEAVFGVIHPPQVALVGFGAPGHRPVAAEGLVQVRPAVTATLTVDHRAADGATGARYLTHLSHLLQHPDQL